MMRSEKLYRCRASHASAEGIPLRLSLKVNVEQKKVTFSFSESHDAKNPHRYLIIVTLLPLLFYVFIVLHARFLTMTIQLGRCTDEGCTVLNTWVGPGPSFFLWLNTSAFPLLKNKGFRVWCAVRDSFPVLYTAIGQRGGTLSFDHFPTIAEGSRYLLTCQTVGRFDCPTPHIALCVSRAYWQHTKASNGK